MKKPSNCLIKKHNNLLNPAWPYGPCSDLRRDAAPAR